MSAPLFTLHGFTGRADAWRDVAPSTGLSLAGHAPDLPVPPGWSFDREVDRIARLIAPGPVHLAGYSMGGRVALALACRRPELIARLTLVSVHPGLSDPQAAKDRVEADERWCALMLGAGMAAFVAEWEAQPMWRSQLALAPAVRERQRRERLEHSPAQLAASLRALGLGAMPDLWPRLAGLPCPVDWVAGADDDRFADLARRASASCGRAIAIAGAGHNLLLERPDEVARILTADPAR